MTKKQAAIIARAASNSSRFAAFAVEADQSDAATTAHPGN